MRPSPIARARELYRKLGGPGRAAAALLALAGVVLVLSARGVVSAMFVPSAAVRGAGDGEEKKRTEEMALAYDGYVAQINGRSLFFVPGPPPPPPAPPAPVVADVTPKPPPAPATYGGPKLIGMINDVAWFDDGKRLKAGDESGGDLRVVRLEGPWCAIVLWNGVEFTVGLFDRDTVVHPAPRPEAQAGASEPKVGEAGTTAAKPPESPEGTPGTSDPKSSNDQKPTGTEGSGSSEKGR